MILPRGLYYGDPVTRRRLGPFQLTETRYQPGTRLPLHRHRDPYLCLVARGSFVETGAQAWTVRAGSVVAHPGGSEHEDQFLADPGSKYHLARDA